MARRPPTQEEFARQMRARRHHDPTRAEASDRATYIKRGQDAWQRHKSDATWTDWLAIGEALDIGRSDAMAAAGTNKPEGSRYNKLFGKWLKDHGFDDIDQGDRKRLFDVLEHRSEIEQWRKSLPQTTRLRLNNPSTIWRKWNVKPKAPGNQSAAARRAAQAKQNERDLKDARAHIAELEAGRDTSLEPLLREAARFIAASYMLQGYREAEMEKDMSAGLFAYAKPELARLYAETKTTKSAKAEQSVFNEPFFQLFFNEPTRRKRKE
jgi:hypothetical protein